MRSVVLGVPQVEQRSGVGGVGVGGVFPSTVSYYILHFFLHTYIPYSRRAVVMSCLPFPHSICFTLVVHIVVGICATAMIIDIPIGKQRFVHGRTNVDQTPPEQQTLKHGQDTQKDVIQIWMVVLSLRRVPPRLFVCAIDWKINPHRGVQQKEQKMTGRVPRHRKQSKPYVPNVGQI